MRSIDIQLHRVPFFLEPDYLNKPDTFIESHEERMIRKFGSLESFIQVKALHGLERRGAEAGLDKIGFCQEALDMRVQSATLNSHRLVLFVEQLYGSEYAEALYNRLNCEHFINVGVLNDRSLLSKCIASIGFSANQIIELEAYLGNSQRGRAETLDLYEQALSLGIDSIPTLIVDGKYALNGAVSAMEVEHVLKQVIREGITGRRAFQARKIV